MGSDLSASSVEHESQTLLDWTDDFDPFHDL